MLQVKTTARILAFICVIPITSAFIFPQTAEDHIPEGVPKIITFSGLLKDSSGRPLNGEVNVNFAIYDEPIGGVLLWDETQAVQFSSGRYTVLLGSGSQTGIPSDLFRSGESRWLGIHPLLDTEEAEEHQPSRIFLASVPYALKASDSDTLGGLPASAFVRIPSSTDRGSSNSIHSGSGLTPVGSTATVNSSTATAGLGNPVLQNPSAPQTITGRPLTITSAANLNGGGALKGTFKGPTITCILNSTMYVGGTCAGSWGSGDIGAQIGIAYAALPSTGGRIVILPLEAGACYNYSTPIVLATPAKYVVLEGISSSNSNNASCLNYRPTTATTAMRIDWTPIRGGGFAPGAGLRDIELINNGCASAGGCGSFATGISIGPSNGGAELGQFVNVTVSGFGIGVSLGSGISYGMLWDNPSVKFNTIGWKTQSSAGVEDLTFIGGHFSENGIGFYDHGGSQVSWTGTAFDANTTFGLKQDAGGNLTFVNPHFENTGATTMHFINSTAGIVQIYGGLAEDDISAGDTDYWFALSAVDVKGLSVFSGGQTVKSLFTIGQQSNISIIDDSPSSLPFASLGVATTGNGMYQVTSSDNSIKAVMGAYVHDWIEGTAPVGITQHDRCYGDSTAHALKCSYNNGSFLRIPQIVASGTSTLNSGSLNSNTCQETVTAAARGATGTDSIEWSFATVPEPADALTTVSTVASLNRVHLVRCNPTSASQNTTAIDIHWRVIR